MQCKLLLRPIGVNSLAKRAARLYYKAINSGVSLLMTFAEKFFNLRKSAGLSQQQAAKRLGVSRQAISRWENGTALPDSLNIAGICTIFGVSADYLVNDLVCENSAAINCVTEQKADSGKFKDGGKAICRYGILFHILAFLLELAGILCFVFSAVIAFWVLFFVGLAVSVIGIITAEFIFTASGKDVRSALRKKYYRRSVWLFLPLPLVVLTVAISYAVAIASSGYGSFTLPVLPVSLLAIVVYFFISIMVTIILSDKK